MKKSLLALAVLGAFAGAAQAQTSISISGLVDLGFQSTDRQGAGADTKGIVGNGSATSTLVFSGTEDLGGGLKAGFFLATDFTPGQNNSRQDTATVGANTYNQQTSTFFNSQNFLSLAGGFGEIKLGNINSQAMAAATTAQPFGTALGGGYSGSFSRLNGQTGLVSGTLQGGGTRIIRTNNTLYYSTPNFAGFQATAGIRFKNDDTAATSNTGAQEVAVSYRANGLNVVLAHYRTDAGAFAAGTLAANAEDRHTLLGANYAFGPATIYAGYTTSKGDNTAGATVVDSTSYNIAGKYAITPALSLAANYVRVNDDTAAEADRSLIGLGADYSLSKRTTAYVRYERQDPNKRVTNDRRSDLAIGVRHTF